MHGKEVYLSPPDEGGGGQPEQAPAKGEEKQPAHPSAGKTIAPEDYEKLSKESETLKKKLADWEAKTAKEETERKKRQEATDKEQGKYRELYEQKNQEIETIKPQLQRYEKVIETYLESELKGIPENLKKLVPDGDVVARLEWVTKAKDAGLFTAKSKGDGTPPPNGKQVIDFTSIYKH